MASPRAIVRTTALLKLIVAVVATGLVASLFFVPYIAGLGMATGSVTDKFLDAKCSLKPATLDQTTTLYARDGITKIATLFKDDRRTVSLSSVPKIAREALIDTEDRRFYQHHGLDVRGLARAALHDSSDSSTQGASTLTQQLVKQIRFFDAGDSKKKQDEATAQTTDRKIYEAKCALKLEQEYSKNQILEQYFNIAFFGEQSYGIAVAAQNYFGVSQSKLTVPQAAMLAGLVRSPTVYDPFNHPAAARERRNEVIANMVAAGHLSARAATKYEASGLGLDDSNHKQVGAQGCAYANDDVIKNVGFFCDYALKWLTTTGGLTMSQVQTGGYKIVTSIDPTLQNKATTKEWKAFPAKSPTALVQPAVDPRNGEVTAFITNKHYNYALTHSAKDPSYTVNPLFTHASGGSGSTFKYFTMLAALTAGVRPNQSLTTGGAKYFPKNCGDWVAKNPANGVTIDAPKTLDFKTAFARSSNIYFVGMEDQVFDCNIKTIVDTALSLGVTSLNAVVPGDNPKHLTYAQRAIQGNEYNFTLGQDSVSPLELASAYGTVANDGVLCAPRPILSVSTTSGKTVKFTQATCARKVSRWVARTALQIMMGPTTGSRGTATAVMYDNFFHNHSSYKYPVAGKTGTNNATVHGKDSKRNAALWFVGVTPTLTSATALFDPNHPTKAIRGVPGFTGDQASLAAYGAYGAKYWAKSFGSTVDDKSWSWPTPDGFDGATHIPYVRGDSVDTAVQRIKDAGFKPVEYPIQCGSNVVPGYVAYVGPQYAKSGDKVYYCLSNGKSLSSAPKPKPEPTKPPKTTPTKGGKKTDPKTTTPTKKTPVKKTPVKKPPPKKKTPH